MSVRNLKILLFGSWLVKEAMGSIASCNVPLLNSFYLTGFETSVHDPMKVCPFVQEKCCTISDEIRITKFWKEKSEPLVKARSSAVNEQMSRIIDMFWPIMSLDIELMILKKVTKRMIPYNYQSCVPNFRTMNEAEVESFAAGQDPELEGYYRLIHSVRSGTESKPFKLSDYQKDETGERSWGVPLTPKQIENERQYNQEVIEFLPPVRLSTTEMECTSHQKTVLREFIIVNEPKTNFCLNLYEKFLSFDIVQFKYTMKVVKSHLNSFSNYKKTFYCFLCDGNLQRFINPEKQLVIFSEPFCKNILKEKEDYIKFLHIIFVEFADSILQYIHCFETDGTVLTLPYQNFLTRFQRRIPLVKKCLASLDQPNFMSSCWFICNKFSLHKFSNFWEGDLEMIDRILIAIKSFLRKFKIEIDEEQLFDEYQKEAGGKPILTTTGNVDGVILEPLIEKLNPSHLMTDKKFYFRAEDRFKMFNTTNTTQITSQNVTSEINDLLKNIGFPSLEQIRLQKKEKEEAEKQLEYLQKTKNMDQSELEELKASQQNGDYSVVNGLQNQRNSALPKQFLSDGMFPQRNLNQLKQEILEKTAKLDPRSLDLVFLTTKFEKISSKNENAKVIAPANITQPIEDISQIFDKAQPTVDISFFDSAIEKEGLDPLKHALSVDYNYNVSSLLDEKFAREEKLSVNVLDAYLSVSAKVVNGFNGDIDLPITGYNEIIAQLTFLPQLEKLIKFAKFHNKAQLLKSSEKMKKQLIIERAAEMQTQEKVRLMKKMKKLTSEMSAELQKIKMEALKNSTTDHVNRPHYKENMNGISGFFTSMFGS